MTRERLGEKAIILGGLALLLLGFGTAELAQGVGVSFPGSLGVLAGLAGVLGLGAWLLDRRTELLPPTEPRPRAASPPETEQLQRFLDRVGQPIIGVDEAGRVSFVNRQFLTLTDWSPQEVLGTSWLTFCHSPNAAAGTPAEQLLREAQSPGERSIPTRSGAERVMTWEYELRRGPQGQVGGCLGVGQDLTERRRWEAQLRQVQKMETIGQLASSAAHEINNMLTVIQGHTDILAQHLAPSDPLLPNVEMIRKAVDRTGGLIRQLLTLRRKPGSTVEVLDLNAVVNDVATLLRPLLGKTIELVTILEPGLGAVKADPTEIEQMLLNLAINARDAMPNGGQLIVETANAELDRAYARVHADVQPGPYVLLVVSDTGSGMTEEVRSHLFEPFFSTKEPGKGSGLGLATVSGIVKQSQGHIKVFSIPGQGSTFRIYLPRVAPTDALVPAAG
jgi:PAS domain S-box-containing protein